MGLNACLKLGRFNQNLKMKATLFFALISLPVILNAQDTLLLMDFNGPDTSLIISGQPSGNNGSGLFYGE